MNPFQMPTITTGGVLATAKPPMQTEKSITMELTRAAGPTLQGIPPELRNQIYGLVVATPTDNRIILGRKLAQAAKKLEYDGDVREQALSAVVQHPLSMACRQIRA